MPTTEYSDHIRQVDKVGAREQRRANCAGRLDGLLENTRPPPPSADCLCVGSVASLCSKGGVLCLGKWVLPKTQRET